MTTDREAFIARCVASGMSEEEAQYFVDELETEMQADAVYQRLMDTAKAILSDEGGMAVETTH